MVLILSDERAFNPDADHLYGIESSILLISETRAEAEASSEQKVKSGYEPSSLSFSEACSIS